MGRVHGEHTVGRDDARPRTGTSARTDATIRVQRVVGGGPVPHGAADARALLALQRLTGNQAVGLVVQRAIDLKDHEDAMGPDKGHALARHVNVDNAYLKTRGIAQATRFKDLATANAMADKAVADRTIASKIESMKKGDRPNASGGVTSAENGIAYVKAQDAFYGAKDILIEVYPYTGAKEPLKSNGWYIMTMYPKTSTGKPPAG